MKLLKWTFLSVLLIMSNANNCIAWETKLEGKSLFVYDVLIENQSDPANLNFSNIDTVQLFRPKISTLTVEMQSQITNVWKLELAYGSVPTVHVAPQFKEYVVWNCSTRNVIINPNVTYSIELLSIVYNNLETLSKHLNALKKLKFLYLHDNKIEYIDMDNFNGLTDLKRIHLRKNKILEITASLVVLPNLLDFYADDNRLTYINFEKWKATSLTHIDLKNNRLSIALHIETVFPSLKSAELDGNYFNCEWLNATSNQLKTRGMKIFAESFPTCNKEAEALDEFWKLRYQNTFATKQEMQNANNLQKSSFNQSHQSQQQKISELEKSFQQFQKEALAEIEQLKHKNADLVEALYLHEIEATNTENVLGNITRKDANDSGTSPLGA